MASCVTTNRIRYKSNYVLLLPFPTANNDAIYFLNNDMRYLESIAEIKKISTYVEHQSAGTYRENDIVYLLQHTCEACGKPLPAKKTT